MFLPNKKVAVVYLLPFGLFLLTYFWLGFFYETNDDAQISFLFRGITIDRPIASLSLYFFCFSRFFVWAYQHFPDVPWYGLMLYLLLYISLALAFNLIFRALKEKLNTGAIFLVCMLVYLAGWYEHFFWFNYMRVPLLLAPLAFLNAISGTVISRKLFLPKLGFYGLLFLLALCIRPSAAILGLLLALPLSFAAILNQSKSLKSALLPVVFFGSLLVIFSIIIKLDTKPEVAAYRRLDVLKSAVLDYQLCCPPTPDRKNTLVMQGLNMWFLGDVKQWEPYVANANPTQTWRYFYQNVLPRKFHEFIRILAFDHFLALVLTFSLFWLSWRYSPRSEFRAHVLYLVYFWLGMLAIGLFLKLPPRIITSAFSILLVGQLAYFLPAGFQLRSLPFLLKLFIGLAVIVQLYKMNHRAAWQQERQRQSETFMHHLSTDIKAPLIVIAELGDEMRALSPFRNYDFQNKQLLMLTGWHVLDPHYSGFYYRLTGQKELMAALEVLKNRQQVSWVMRPAFKNFLEEYTVVLYHKQLHWQPDAAASAALQPSEFKAYK